MVACDVGVEVLPAAFDAIVVRAVGRQEVKDESTVHVGNDATYEMAIVNSIVVDNKMNAARVAIADAESKEEQREECAVLLRSIDPCHLLIVRGQCASNVALHVLTGRNDATLMSAKHPIATDAWVQMNVDFIRIEHGLASRRARCERTERAQHPLFSSAWPRAKHDRTRHPKSRANVAERSTIVQTATLRNPRRAISRQSTSRVHVGRGQPKSCGVR